MDNLWWVRDFPWWHLVVRVSVVYAAVLFLLRLGGKRQIGQMAPSHFVALLLISNAVQNSMNGGDNSIGGGLVLAAVLVVMSFLVSALTYYSKDWENFIQGRPTLLIHHGVLVRANLEHELMSLRELRVLLRREGVNDLSEVKEAVLESDGYVSIVRKSESEWRAEEKPAEGREEG